MLKKSWRPQKQWAQCLSFLSRCFDNILGQKSCQRGWVCFSSRFQGAVCHGGEAKMTRAWCNWCPASRVKKQRERDMHVNALCTFCLWNSPGSQPRIPAQGMLPWSATKVDGFSHFNYSNQDTPTHRYTKAILDLIKVTMEVNHLRSLWLCGSKPRSYTC